jgi:hypothetical protein
MFASRSQQRRRHLTDQAVTDWRRLSRLEGRPPTQGSASRGSSGVAKNRVHEKDRAARSNMMTLLCPLALVARRYFISLEQLGHQVLELLQL